MVRDGSNMITDDNKTRPGFARKFILIPVGMICLAIGGIGIFVPLLPTTPLVILAAGCFASSSPRLYEKLVNTRYFGEYIRNYREKTGITRSTRIVSLVFLWSLLGVSAYFMRSNSVVLAILLIVGIAVSIHILTIRRMITPITMIAETDDL